MLGNEVEADIEAQVIVKWLRWLEVIIFSDYLRLQQIFNGDDLVNFSLLSVHSVRPSTHNSETHSRSSNHAS